jgi:IS4 transposase
MIRKLEEGSLLLADDLYNSYYHFSLIRSHGCHIIVPGKRKRRYAVKREISGNDQIVEISKPGRPGYVSEQEWGDVPDKLELRRIAYTYPTKNGLEDAALYTTLLDEGVHSAEIVAKYGMRWDIEISMREVKEIMDIRVLRSKSRDMLFKELLIALTAYNMVRKIIAKSAGQAGFSPQESFVQECYPFSKPILLDKKGRVFHRWSPGRYGRADEENQRAYHT